MRCFLAIELPEQIKSRLVSLQQQLTVLRQAVRWTRPEHIHLTIKFLGEVPDKDVPTVCQVATSIASAHEPFKLEIAGTGCFPPSGPERIVWAGVNEPPPALLTFQKAIEQEYAKLGFAPEGRAYSPHLTIGRGREGTRPGQIRNALRPHATMTTGRFDVREVVVFQSILGPEGPKYIALAHAPFGKKA